MDADRRLMGLMVADATHSVDARFVRFDWLLCEALSMSIWAQMHLSVNLAGFTR